MGSIFSNFIGGLGDRWVVVFWGGVLFLFHVLKM